MVVAVFVLALVLSVMIITLHFSEMLRNPCNMKIVRVKDAGGAKSAVVGVVVAISSVVVTATAV